MENLLPFASIRVKIMRCRKDMSILSPSALGIEGKSEWSPKRKQTQYVDKGGSFAVPAVLEEEDDDGVGELDEADFVEIDYSKSRGRKSISAENTSALPATSWDSLPNNAKTPEQSALIKAFMKNSFIFSSLTDAESDR